MYNVRPASVSDAILLPRIERSAGELFRQIPKLAWIADDTVQSVERHLELIALGTVWVAIDQHDTPVAFLNGEPIGHRLHIWEMSVHAKHQRNGLGAWLIREAKAYALAAGYAELTLTTFRDVPWNDLFYAQHGFALAEGLQLTPALEQILLTEAAAGLPRNKRCAMVMKLVSQAHSNER